MTPFYAKLASVLILCAASPAWAQPPEPEDVRVPTADGLKLEGKWFPGGKGKQSDSVLLLHRYGVDGSCYKGEWENLAKGIQKEGYSVLMFDLRGHGKNKGQVRAMGDGEKFCAFKFNALAGAGLNAKNPPKSLDVTKFNDAYYPYLINDLAAARRFLDRRNDEGSCNSGRIFIIADRESCPLAIYFSAIEFDRNGIFPAVPGANAPKHDAGSDIMGIVCLSYVSKWSMPYEHFRKLPHDGNTKVLPGLRDKVGFMFVDNEKSNQNAAKAWYGRWNITVKGNDSADPDKAKNMFLLKGSEALAGIDLLAPKKALGVNELITQFIKKTDKKNINGNDWVLRNAGVVELEMVPLELYGVR